MTKGFEGTFWGLRVKQPPIVNNHSVKSIITVYFAERCTVH